MLHKIKRLAPFAGFGFPESLTFVGCDLWGLESCFGSPIAIAIRVRRMTLAWL